MKEVKVRDWNFVNSKMVNNLAVMRNFISMIASKNFVLIQFTGSKDMYEKKL